MNQFQLNWTGPFKVSEIRKKVLEESIAEIPSWMTWQGIYVFLDQKFHVLYVGSATKATGYALRSRIREHLREGAQTSFSRQLKKYNMKIDDLQIIAAPDAKEEFTYNDILKIEGIIIRRMNPPGNSVDGEVTNYGSFKPALPERIRNGLSGYLKACLTE